MPSGRKSGGSAAEDSMDAYLLDWVNLLLRWAHVVTAIAWIGASFHFVMLDSSLLPPTHDEPRAKGVDGEMWAVHGGGFYHFNKYLVAPRWLPLPQRLHWSYWESYSTWLTGFALFVASYLLQPGAFLVDRSVHDWSPTAAVAASLALLAAFWLAYDLLCRALGQRAHGDLLVGAGVLALVVLASWLACRLFAGRAAFLLVGAMLATAMTANVLMVIIPGQRKVVAALRAGRAPDAVHGRRGRQRSVHNTYFTLPVLVAMLSNHHGWLHQGPRNWIVLVLLMLAGALVRHSFVARHRALAQGRRVPWEHAVAGLAAIGMLVAWLAPAPPAGSASSAGSASPAGSRSQAGSGPGGAGPAAGFDAVRAVVEQRCVACHNARLPSKNVALDSAEAIGRHALAVYQQATVLRLMPLNNATRITADERALIGRWYEAGAPLR